MHSRILVVRFGALGDVVLLTPLLRALRAKFASARIDVLTKESLAPLLDTHPAISEVIPLRSGASVQQLARHLEQRSYDCAIDVHGSLRSRMLSLLAPGPWHTIQKYRWERFLNIWTGRTAPLTHVAERYLETVSDLGIEPDGQPPDLHVTPEDRARAGAIAPGDYVVLAPGAQHATKRWPASHWRELAKRLGNLGVRMVGTGLPHESSVLADTDVIAAYDLPLRNTVALIAGAKAVVAHDSGLLHVATGVRVPVVGIYGPTDPRLGYAPYRAASKTVGVTLLCRPCSVYGGPRCPAGHHRCMNALSPSAVLEALQEWL